MDEIEQTEEQEQRSRPGVLAWSITMLVRSAEAIAEQRAREKRVNQSRAAGSKIGTSRRWSKRREEDDDE